MTLSAVVQHLQILEASGLVRSQKVGRVHTCHIEPKALRRAEQWIAAPRELGTSLRTAWRLSRRTSCRSRRKG
jgi:DNA-binding transcriptional ArsR family regulator